MRRYVSVMGRCESHPLLLKSPAYTAELGWLGLPFRRPGSFTSIATPARFSPSNARVLGIVLRELALQPVPEDAVEATVLEAYPRVMDRLFEDARHLPAHRFAEIAYVALVADPLGTLGRVCDHLGLPARPESLLGECR